MTATSRSRLAALATIAICLGAASPLRAQPSLTRTERPVLTPQPGILSQVKFEQKPGSRVPPGLRFRDESGAEVALGDLMQGRPIVLNLVYFDCPLLCNQVLDGFVRSLNVLDNYTVGDDFDVVSVSINPREVPEAAMAKEAAVMRAYHHSGDAARAGWHFLTTDDKATIDALADSVGFSYTFNPRSNLYAHAAGLVFLTPEGTVSRYVYGISYPARDLRLALVEASRGEIGGVVEQAMLLCYAYDPESGTYSFAIMNIVRLLGIATVLGLGVYMTAMIRRDRRRIAVLDQGIVKT